MSMLEMDMSLNMPSSFVVNWHPHSVYNEMYNFKIQIILLKMKGKQN